MKAPPLRPGPAPMSGPRPFPQRGGTPARAVRPLAEACRLLSFHLRALPSPGVPRSHSSPCYPQVRGSVASAAPGQPRLENIKISQPWTSSAPGLQVPAGSQLCHPESPQAEARLPRHKAASRRSRRSLGFSLLLGVVTSRRWRKGACSAVR